MEMFISTMNSLKKVMHKLQRSHMFLRSVNSLCGFLSSEASDPCDSLSGELVLKLINGFAISACWLIL